MTIEKFIKGFNERTSDQVKVAYVQARIVKKYVPFEEKIAICKGILDATKYVTVDGKKTFHSNSPSKYMNYVMRTIAAYTDLEIGKTGNVLGEFNMLEEADLTNVIIGNINPSETERMKAILKMMEADIDTNERALTAFIESKLAGLSLAENSLLSAFQGLKETAQNE